MQAKGFTLMDGVLSNVFANGISAATGKVTEFVGSLFELGDATEEYRSMMAKVGRFCKFVWIFLLDLQKINIKRFYSYVKDDQMATNAITNLMGMKVSTEAVSNAADASIAVWSAYGDSIPIEGLTEAINESAIVGQVTASLADTINWAKRSNEDWTAAMAGHTEAQKAFLIKDCRRRKPRRCIWCSACRMFKYTGKSRTYSTNVK